MIHRALLLAQSIRSAEQELAAFERRLARFRAACGFDPADVLADVETAAACLHTLRLQYADATSDD
jgi:hypothetical protein